MQKLLWIDVETSGLSCVKNDILTIAGIIEIDGNIAEEFYFKCQPHDWNTINEEALKINGITIEELKSFEHPAVTHQKLINIFKKYVNKFDKKDKFIPAGHNVNFDVDFLFKFFEKCNDKYCGSWIDYHKLDSIPLLQILALKGAIKLDNFKLETVAKHFGIEFAAHDALADIHTTRTIIKTLLNRIEYKEPINENNIRT